MVSFRSFVIAVSMLPTMATAMYNYVVETEAIEDSTVTGKVILTMPGGLDDSVCWSGTAVGLEESLVSFKNGGGNDCQARNGCRAHIHKGTSCDTSTSQGTF